MTELEFFKQKNDMTLRELQGYLRQYRIDKSIYTIHRWCQGPGSPHYREITFSDAIKLSQAINVPMERLGNHQDDLECKLNRLREQGGDSSCPDI